MNQTEANRLKELLEEDARNDFANGLIGLLACVYWRNHKKSIKAILKGYTYMQQNQTIKGIDNYMIIVI